MPLIRDKGLSVDIRPTTLPGVYIADATNNPTGAFKIHGAIPSGLAAKTQGGELLVTASAGNHGAGVAYAARLLGMHARIYVPVSAPEVKVAKIRGFGAEVVKVGSCFDDCLVAARLDEHVCSTRGFFVHPFDSMMVAAGQGTIGVDILEGASRIVANTDCDVVRVYLPIGGGGLMAGVASVLKTRWPNTFPPLEIIGVVDESSPASLIATLFGRPVKVSPTTIADGTRVAQVGETFLSVSHLVDRLILVPHDAIVSAMRLYKELNFHHVEGAGALALAGVEAVRHHALLGAGSRALNFAVLTGRNVDVSTYHEAVTAAPRIDLASHQRQGFDVVIPEEPGELLHFLETVRAYNIASLTYKQRPDSPSGILRVEFEVRTSAVDHLERDLSEAFPGSRRLAPGEHMIYEVGHPVARGYREELITLDDRPGSFHACISELSRAGRFGSVGFLFYRKPPAVGTKAQVVVGRIPPGLALD